MSEPRPTNETISRHLRSMHGYGTVEAVAAHPSVLMQEHDRIHEKLDPSRINHKHEEKQP